MSTRRVPDLFVEQLAHGELSTERAREIRRQLEAEPGGLERLAAVKASDAAILRALPPERVAREVRALSAQRGTVPSGTSWRSWAMWTAPVLAVAVALIVVGQVDTGPQGQPYVTVDDGVRAKGDVEPQLKIYVMTDDGPRPVDDGELLAAGAVLQVAYLSAGQAHGVVLSIDGNQAITLHHPTKRKGSTALEGGGEIRLPDAFELDDAPSFESFLFVTDDEPLDVERLINGVKARGPGEHFADGHGNPLPTARFTVRKAKR